MAKGDDALARKKNKSNRKKMNRKNDSATVSARVASIIAAKKRRQSGKRSMCQGMCFSLPTPEDPFNERQGKADKTKKRKKEAKSRDALSVKKGSFKSVGSSNRQGKKPSLMPIDDGDDGERIDAPLKNLMSCLNEIETSFRSDDHLLTWRNSAWGFEFWKLFKSGKDVLETTGASSNMEQIAWIVSTATDDLARLEEDEQEEEEEEEEEKEKSLSNNPFLVYLVPSQSKASQVRSVCKALKDFGIHAVSLHQGAELNHQIAGLKSCKPEFLISTPERLLEIVNLKGVDISGVSMLVIDELGSLCTSGYLDAVKSIKQTISSEHRTIVFNDSVSASCIAAVQSLMRGSINRLALSDSVASQASCITQTINVCASEEKKLQKFSEVVDSSTSKVIYIVTKEESFRKFKALLKLKGLSVSTNTDFKMSEVKKSRKPLARLVDIEQLDTTVMGGFETVLLPDFVRSYDTYVQILTSMARDSLHGVLHSFLTEKQAVSYPAGSLVNLLEDCGQHVPDTWRNMYASMSG